VEMVAFSVGKEGIGGPFEMEELLVLEGVEVQKDQVKEFRKLFWDPTIELSLD